MSKKLSYGVPNDVQSAYETRELTYSFALLEIFLLAANSFCKTGCKRKQARVRMKFDEIFSYVVFQIPVHFKD